MFFVLSYVCGYWLGDYLLLLMREPGKGGKGLRLLVPTGYTLAFVEAYGVFVTKLKMEESSRCLVFRELCGGECARNRSILGDRGFVSRVG